MNCYSRPDPFSRLGIRRIFNDMMTGTGLYHLVIHGQEISTNQVIAQRVLKNMQSNPTACFLLMDFLYLVKMDHHWSHQLPYYRLQRCLAWQTSFSNWITSCITWTGHIWQPHKSRICCLFAPLPAKRVNWEVDKSFSWISLTKDLHLSSSSGAKIRICVPVTA